MSVTQEKARAALRARQGGGARYDADMAPAQELDWARRGTAYFARILINLSDEALLGASAVPGKNRSWVVAATALQARMLAEAVACVRSNSSVPAQFEFVVDASEIALAATLPPQALRNLFAHSEVHLNVEWRDLEDEGWDAAINDRHGRQLRMRESPRIRAYRLWHCAVQLRSGGREIDIPSELQSTRVDVGDPLPMF